MFLLCLLYFSFIILFSLDVYANYASYTIVFRITSNIIIILMTMQSTPKYMFYMNDLSKLLDFSLYM